MCESEMILPTVQGFDGSKVNNVRRNAASPQWKRLEKIWTTRVTPYVNPWILVSGSKGFKDGVNYC